ncbi:hypothetical protein BAUCODRAFT_29832, partial [Baudoinia panamericana UAMH 10762]
MRVSRNTNTTSLRLSCSSQIARVAVSLIPNTTALPIRPPTLCTLSENEQHNRKTIVRTSLPELYPSLRRINATVTIASHIILIKCLRALFVRLTRASSPSPEAALCPVDAKADQRQYD